MYTTQAERVNPTHPCVHPLRQYVYTKAHMNIAELLTHAGAALDAGR